MKKIINKIFAKRERVYYFLLFFTFCLVVLSQICMRIDGMMGYFSAIETFEGDFISDEEMFNKAEFVLEIKGDIRSESYPEIYLNGERAGFLDEKRKKLIIETDTAVEIFCEAQPGDIMVDVSYDDKKLINYTRSYPVRLKAGFNPVARFSFV